MRIDIERIGINGEGIGKITSGEDVGKIIFVDKALPGEKIDATIIKNTKKFAIGALNNILVSNENRIKPKCQFFSECGGCQYQHVNYDNQKQYKINNVIGTIEKIADIKCKISEYVSDKQFNYRNKMVFPIGSEDGHAYLAMFKGDSHQLVKINSCAIATPLINAVLSDINEYLHNNFHGFDFRKNIGDIKYFVCRVKGNDILVTMVVTKKIDFSGLYEVLCKHSKNCGISMIISDNKNEILSGKYMHIKGIDCLNIDEFGIKYHIDNRGFLQVNDIIKNKLYSSVLEFIDKECIVLDAYSGAGLLSGIISKKAKKVVGVEINHSACESAKNLIKENNLENVDYFEGDVKDYIDICLKDNIDVIVLDPPRSGCDRNILLKINNREKIEKVIYISCNPSTLARDILVLKERFEIINLSLFDMFPQTKHVETLVVLERKF